MHGPFGMALINSCTNFGMVILAPVIKGTFRQNLLQTTMTMVQLFRDLQTSVHVLSLLKLYKAKQVDNRFGMGGGTIEILVSLKNL